MTMFWEGEAPVPALGGRGSCRAECLRWLGRSLALPTMPRIMPGPGVRESTVV